MGQIPSYSSLPALLEGNTGILASDEEVCNDFEVD